ncbi:hypothetical protein [Methylobacter luteus]|uniref:hypothetical protein n=1 Tax=Methylobacter luteus TaxID=415 RepID=UPI000484FF85|nr:hypothetical protein [Methylobacter luteus]
MVTGLIKNPQTSEAAICHFAFPMVGLSIAKTKQHCHTGIAKQGYWLMNDRDFRMKSGTAEYNFG